MVSEAGFVLLGIRFESRLGDRLSWFAPVSPEEYPEIDDGGFLPHSSQFP